ncbi:SDR family NAD(P)-dependent oxidoreductase [Paenibacillus tengchongensis]|uniref:SDR family NAD(P)-dependent oxidoreductase n=1 Tax=Paenibacillus tengchongensis TaxID=2608684 RepID=UPI00124D2E46|nr:SDR family NAD(P)-dependent oxidoreductase [Paenibacillus tengchongensis]
MDNTKRYIYKQVANQQLNKEEAKKMLLELQNLEDNGKDDIAIIGISGKFPEAENIHEFWDHLCNGKSCIGEFPQARKEDFNSVLKNPNFAEIFLGTKLPPDTDYDDIYGKGGFLRQIDKFDAGFFRIPPKEAKFMSPIQRLFLEVAWEAIEDSGYGGNNLVGSKTGVFVGNDHTALSLYKYITEMDQLHETGSWAGILASRISYLLNLQGPSMVIDTACSSGLVAIHQACMSLKNQECDYAIAGGIHIMYTSLKIEESENNVNLKSVKSVDDKVKTFDKYANGTVWSEGVGALILKPLSKALTDKDNIYAVIKGSAINNDGASNGITAPNPEAQEDVILKAWKDARISPETISYIEAHGTGTVLGDPIEIKGITKAFLKHTNRKQFCGIGSVKANIGHLVGAAGIASAFKVILALKHKMIPPSINFSEPNPYINFPESPVYINDTLRVWEQGNSPCRAGVSSFGFSGTNCHMVFEEAPENHVPVRHHEAPLVLSLSTRNKETLLKLVHGYIEFLNQNPEIDIRDVCYTANSGRGQYSSRLAIMFDTAEQLIERLEWAEQNMLATDPNKGIYFGEHKLVRKTKALKDSNEITDKDKEELSLSINHRLSGISDATILKSLCEAFVKGADINWGNYYESRERKRVSIPTYPLERIRFWADPKTIGMDEVVRNDQAGYPLIERHLVDSINQGIFETSFDAMKHWVLFEHKILGNCVVPGTAYLEIASEAFRKYFGNEHIEFRDVVFLTPIIVEENNSKPVQIIISVEEDHFLFTFASKNEDATILEQKKWTIHAEGKIYHLQESELPVYKIEELKEACPTKLAKRAPSAEGDTVVFGPRWDNIDETYVGEGQSLLEIHLPAAYKQDLLKHSLHPALLDNAVNGIIQAVGDGGLYLPLSYKEFKVYADLPEHFYSYIKVKENKGHSMETVSFEIILVDEQGKCLCKINDYVIKKVHEASSKFKLSKKTNQYLESKWILDENEGNPSKKWKSGAILIFSDSRGLSLELADLIHGKDSNELIHVSIGSEYTRLNNHNYIISGKREDYIQLLQDLKGVTLTEIVHMSSVSQRNLTYEANILDEEINRGVNSLFYLVSALINEKINNQINIAIISESVHAVDHLESDLFPQHAPLYALGKVINQEYQNLICRSIDIEMNTTAQDIFSELNNSTPLYLCALRKGQRYVEQLTEIDADKLKRRNIEIRSEGVYIITGGLGGIGLEIAKYLTAKNKVNLIFFNRTRLPDRDQWKFLLEEDKEHPYCRKIQAVLEMEQSGSEVMVLAADISNEEEMEQHLYRIQKKYNKINGVIHCAGVAGGGFLFRKDDETFKKVIDPKIKGTMILDHLLAENTLDFFIMFSSIATLIGEAGQGDYTAANSFLDSYAQYGRSHGKNMTTINWPAWNDTGMALEHDALRKEGLFRSVSTLTALQIFEEILNYDISRIIPAEINLQMAAGIEGQLPLALSQELRHKIEQYKRKYTAPSTTQKAHMEETIIRGTDGEYSEIEKDLARIWASVLELTEIDIFDNFHDLGGDSILATQLIKAIQSKYPGVVDISDIFSYPTVYQLACSVEDRMNKKENSVPQHKNHVGMDDIRLLNLLDELEAGSLSIDGTITLLEGKE